MWFILENNIRGVIVTINICDVCNTPLRKFRKRGTTTRYAKQNNDTDL